MFVEVTGEKLEGGLFAPSPILNRVKVGLGRKKGGLDPNAYYGNIYGNILKNTVVLLMGQPLFLKTFRM